MPGGEVYIRPFVYEKLLSGEADALVPMKVGAAEAEPERWEPDRMTGVNTSVEV